MRCAMDGEMKGAAMIDSIEKLSRIMAFRELALRFLDSFNPQPKKAIVIANAIVDYDESVGIGSLRYFSHDFVRMAYDRIENDREQERCIPIGDWLNRWHEKNR